MAEVKYPSRYSPERLVTPAQYIAEYMCEHIATLQKKDLPQKFWQDSEWSKIYVREIAFCHKLLKMEVHPRAIMKALKDRRCFPVKMLAWFWKVPKFTAILKEHNDRVKAEEEAKLEVTKGADVTQKPSRPVLHRSKVNRLKGL